MRYTTHPLGRVCIESMEIFGNKLVSQNAQRIAGRSGSLLLRVDVGVTVEGVAETSIDTDTLDI